jgi:taurine dioxygenase
LFRLYADEHSSYVVGEGWHVDGTGETAPPMGGLMVIEELPPIGGDTLFVSAHEAYRRLSPAMQGFLRGLKAEHSAAKAWGRVNYTPPAGGFPVAVHPVVIRHPVTGTESLFVNSGFTTHIVGLTRAESDALLAFLFRHLETPDFACRFRWQPGSVALWDNRAVQHCVLFNFQPQRRSGWRYTIQGPRTQPA